MKWFITLNKNNLNYKYENYNKTLKNNKKYKNYIDLEDMLNEIKIKDSNENIDSIKVLIYKYMR